MSTLLTNGEHDTLWRGGVNSIIKLVPALNGIYLEMRRMNTIEVAKELHNMGALTDEEYADILGNAVREQ